VQQSLLIAGLPRPRQLVLIENAELHGPSLRPACHWSVNRTQMQ